MLPPAEVSGELEGSGLLQALAVVSEAGLLAKEDKGKKRRVACSWEEVAAREGWDKQHVTRMMFWEQSNPEAAAVEIARMLNGELVATLLFGQPLPLLLSR